MQPKTRAPKAQALEISGFHQQWRQFSLTRVPSYLRQRLKSQTILEFWLWVTKTRKVQYRLRQWWRFGRPEQGRSVRDWKMTIGEERIQQWQDWSDKCFHLHPRFHQTNRGLNLSSLSIFLAQPLTLPILTSSSSTSSSALKLANEKRNKVRNTTRETRVVKTHQWSSELVQKTDELSQHLQYVNLG